MPSRMLHQLCGCEIARPSLRFASFRKIACKDHTQSDEREQHGSMQKLRVEQRFNRPPRSGNGGYACGLLACACRGTVAVRLRLPPPLETDLILDRGEGAGRLLDGDKVVAEARPSEVNIELPSAPSQRREVFGLNSATASRPVDVVGLIPADFVKKHASSALSLVEIRRHGAARFRNGAYRRLCRR